MKICSKCKERKPLIEFHKDKTNTSGYYSCCKKCKSSYMSNRWKNNSEYRNKKKEEDKKEKYILEII